MNLVLAIEPDSSQADPLSSVFSDDLGAELVLVTSAFAASVAVNRAVPDLVLFGQSVTPEQRTRILAHIASRTGSPAITTLDIPPFADSTSGQSRSEDSDPASFASQIASHFNAARSDVTTRDGASASPSSDEGAEPDGSASAAESRRHSADFLSMDLQAAREALAAEVEEARREAEFAAAREATRIRAEAAVAIEEARMAAGAEVTRRALEGEIARIKAGTEAQVQAAMARAREDTEAQIREQVARAKAEAEARLEEQLANVRGEAEQVRQAHQQAVLEADRIRIEAATAAREAAEIALAAETERIRAEAQQHLETEIAELRAKANHPPSPDTDAGAQTPAPVPEPPAPWWALSWIPRVRWHLVRWDLAAAAAAVLLVAGGAAFGLTRLLSPAPQPSSTEAVSTPVPPPPPPPKEPEVPIVKPAPVVSKPVNPDPEALPKFGSGILAAFSSLPMEMYADGRRLGTTEDGQILLPPGRHLIDFVSRRFNYQATASVIILPGKVTAHTVALPVGQLHVYTTAGSEVWIDGERVGIAPLDPMAIPIGTRDVLVRDGSGERRQMVEVRYGETSEVTITPLRSLNAPRPVPRLAPLSQYQPAR